MKTFRPIAVALCAAALVTCGSRPAQAQCTDSTTIVYGNSVMTRTAGNHLYSYGETWVVGNYRLWFEPHVSSALTLPDLTGLQSSNYSAPGGRPKAEFHRDLSLSNLGLYQLWSFHSTYNIYCGYWSPPYEGGWNGYTYNSYTVQRPTISAPYTAFWWLGTGTGDYYPNGYYDYTVVTADGKGAPETPTWILVQNGTSGVDSPKVSLSCTPCAAPWVRSLRTESCNYDVRLKASFGGLESEELAMAVNRPWALAMDGVDDLPSNSGEHHGYESRVYYFTNNVCGNHDHLATLVNNEQFSNWTNNSGEGDPPTGVWPQPGSQGYAGFVNPDPNIQYRWYDAIWARGASWSPPTQNPQNPLLDPPTLVMSATQVWRFGSSTVGSGIQLQAGTVQFYIDHGRVQQ